MISFVWSAKYPFLAGTGGSETYTAGHIRELTRRGIPCRIITVGFGENDGREGFPDINFKAINSKEELSELDDTLVFVTYPLKVKTKHQSYVILHCPPMAAGIDDPLFDYSAMADKRLIATSKFAGKLWSKKLSRGRLRIPTVYPFAEKSFSLAERPKPKSDLPRVLFAGRLTPDKGIYTLLAALHLDGLRDARFKLSVTTAGMHTDDGEIIYKLLKAHPKIKVIPARKTPDGMAKLVADQDIVVMPSTDIFWKEAFGFLSVEAQHAGCRVVASKAGGLIESNCGGLILANPDDPLSLAKNLTNSFKLGALSDRQRQLAQTRFTVAASVDALLSVIKQSTQKSQPRVGPVRLGQLPQLALFGDRLIRSMYEGVNQDRRSLSARKSLPT